MPVDHQSSDRLPPDPTREQILGAGATMFAQRGYHTATVPELFRAAGVSRATFYRHFSGKSQVLRALTERAAAASGALADELRIIADDPRPGPVNELHRWLSDYVRFERTYRGAIRTWFDGTSRTHTGPTADEPRDALWSAARDLLSAKGLRPVNTVDPEIATAVFVSVLARLTEPISLRMGRAAEEDAATTADVLQKVLLRSLLGWRVD